LTVDNVVITAGDDTAVQSCPSCNKLLSVFLWNTTRNQNGNYIGDWLDITYIMRNVLSYSKPTLVSIMKIITYSF